MKMAFFGANWHLFLSRKPHWALLEAEQTLEQQNVPPLRRTATGHLGQSVFFSEPAEYDLCSMSSVITYVSAKKLFYTSQLCNWDFDCPLWPATGVRPITERGFVLHSNLRILSSLNIWYIILCLNWEETLTEEINYFKFNATTNNNNQMMSMYL